MLFLPTVGPLFCHPSRCSGPQASSPARRQSSVLDRASGFMSPASSSLVVFASRAARGLAVSQHHSLFSARCACRVRRLLEILQRDITFSSSSLAVIMALYDPPTMALHGSPASLHARTHVFRQAVCSSTCSPTCSLPHASPELGCSGSSLCCWTDQHHLRPLQLLCVEVILLPANTRHPALVISLSTDAIVLRVFRPGLRVMIPPKLCCDSPQLSPLRLATSLMVSGHFSTQTCLC